MKRRGEERRGVGREANCWGKQGAGGGGGDVGIGPLLVDKGVGVTDLVMGRLLVEEGIGCYGC